MTQRKRARKSTDIAPPEEILSTLTQIMRGEITDTAMRKVEGGEEAVPMPPKVSERAHAAEMLGKRYGLFTEKSEGGADKTALADEIEEAFRQLAGGGA